MSLVKFINRVEEAENCLAYAKEDAEKGKWDNVMVAIEDAQDLLSSAMQYAEELDEG